ncbi:MAG TPA: TonB-dependent receptor [Opitutaceae bacterium]|nr:TonB-dependent receptor [Opitutaceae bacterium]
MSPLPSISRRRWPALILLLSIAGWGYARGQTVAGDSPRRLEPMVVTATRTPQPVARVPATLKILTASTVRSAPTITVDDALRAIPSFTLFRRNDSLTANPTTQGVSLRGLGPNGASRSLVLLDGVPLNDPFGGWVAWNQIPRDAVGRVEILPGGGASAWGNAALAGVIQLFTATPVAEPSPTGPTPGALPATARRAAQFTATAGDFGTHGLSTDIVSPAGPGTLQLLGEDFATNGVLLVAPERRGPIDTPAWSRHESAIIRWNQALGPNAGLTATVRSFDEQRGNGTPYQRNGTREKFASVQAAGQPSDALAWTATAYAQEQSYASTFSSVNASRTAETPASNQFAVPATAFGAGVTAAWTHADGGQTSVGGDVRTVQGETREDYAYVNGAYTRLRVAGGSQVVAGAYALHEQPLGTALRLTVGLRADEWANRNGRRRESVLATGALTRNDRYPTRTGTELSPSVGMGWTPAPGWRVHANAQQAFREPTLNELYRPFRQGANVTEANADLKTEHVTSGEVGADWTLMRAASPTTDNRGRPVTQSKRPWLTLGATLFADDLRNEVANVTVARGPGTFPLFGTLPAGGIGRQRLNLDRTRVQGAELSATWAPTTTLSLTANFLYDDATVRAARVAPALVGKQLAEVPRHSATVTATWQAPGSVTFTPRLRWLGRQWDDDENTLRLGEAVVVDLGISRPVGKRFEVFVNLENIGNARVETARSADGLFNLGTPRFIFGGLRASW